MWDVQVVLLQPKRTASDVVISKYSYLRVHAQPKRFLAAYSVDWQVRCLVLCPDFLSLNVPSCHVHTGVTHMCHISDILQLRHWPAAQSRLIHVGEHFVVVSKPPGIPVVPCVCNILESCLACAAQVRSDRDCKICAVCC